MNFFNRNKELKFLEKKYREKGAHFIVIYGKRRVGKTELVKQFFRNKPHIYFLADKTSSYDQLKQISEKIAIFYKDNFLKERGFGNWLQVFEYLSRKKGRTVFVIDEFPYLVEADSAIPSLFQKGWDEYLKDTSVFLLLLGSSISMMESEVLSYKSPLYGRRTGQFLIEPLRFKDLSLFFPDKDFEERLKIYATLGGTPMYLLQFDRKNNIFDNIRNKILSKGEILYEEPEFILKEELREPRNYFAILKAIASGKTKLGEIINETGFQKNILSKYLSVIGSLGIIKREVPVTEVNPEKSKRGIYKIEDSFFRFWFKFVFPSRGYIEEGAIDTVLNRIKKGFTLYLGEIYEKIAREILWELSINGEIPLRLSRIGRWWKKDEEIDLVGIDDETNEIIFGEIKWKNKPLGINILENLRAKSKLVELSGKSVKQYFVLFSKGGFTEELKRIAKKENLFLIEKGKLNFLDF